MSPSTFQAWRTTIRRTTTTAGSGTVLATIRARSRPDTFLRPPTSSPRTTRSRRCPRPTTPTAAAATTATTISTLPGASPSAWPTTTTPFSLTRSWTQAAPLRRTQATCTRPCPAPIARWSSANSCGTRAGHPRPPPPHTPASSTRSTSISRKRRWRAKRAPTCTCWTSSSRWRNPLGTLAKPRRPSSMPRPRASSPTRAGGATRATALLRSSTAPLTPPTGSGRPRSCGPARTRSSPRCLRPT
mmetsp:Transcript_23845/g.76064  ORF Transcript_23845/g.76064 Transcript_23845/m.76064 type:complete len:244 (+) Transcript_23845:1214-1945(+)